MDSLYRKRWAGDAEQAYIVVAHGIIVRSNEPLNTVLLYPPTSDCAATTCLVMISQYCLVIFGVAAMRFPSLSLTTK